MCHFGSGEFSSLRRFTMTRFISDSHTFTLACWSSLSSTVAAGRIYRFPHRNRALAGEYIVRKLRTNPLPEMPYP